MMMPTPKIKQHLTLKGAATIALVVAVVVLYVIVSVNGAADSEDRARQQAADVVAAERQADELCEKVARINQTVYDFIVVLSAPRAVPDGATPAQIEGYRQTNAERDAVRALGEAMFTPSECADGLRPPSALPPGTVAP